MKETVRKILARFSWKDFLLTCSFLVVFMLVLDYFFPGIENYKITERVYWIHTILRASITSLIFVMLMPLKVKN